MQGLWQEATEAWPPASPRGSPPPATCQSAALDVPPGSGKQARPCSVLRREVFIIPAAGRREVGFGSVRNAGAGSALSAPWGQRLPQEPWHCRWRSPSSKAAPGCHGCLLLTAKLNPTSVEWGHCPLPALLRMTSQPCSQEISPQLLPSSPGEICSICCTERARHRHARLPSGCNHRVLGAPQAATVGGCGRCGEMTMSVPR